MSNPKNIRIPSQSWWVLGAVFILILLINLDYTAVNLALVNIAADVGADLNAIQWLLSGYVLAWAALIVPVGKLADIYGKRRMLLLGVSIFAIASFLIGVGTDLSWLIMGRALQGAGGAFFVPCLYALIFQLFPPERQGFAIGILGGGAGIGLAIGPSLSGFILAYVNWRWLFFVNIPLAGFVIGTILYALRKEPSELLKEKIDVISAAFFALGLTTLMLSLNQASTDDPIFSAFYLGLISAGAFISFVARQRKAIAPLIPKWLLQNKTYMFGATLPFMAHQFCFSIVVVVVNLYMQNILGISAFSAGLVFLILTVTFGILSIWGGKVVDSLGLRTPSIAGLFILGAGTFVGLFLSFQESYSLLFLLLGLCGVGFGLCFSSLNTAMMKSVPTQHVTLASSVFTMGCLVAHTVAVLLASAIVELVGGMYLSWDLMQFEGILNVEQRGLLYTLLRSAHRSADLFQGLPLEHLSILTETVNQSYLKAQALLFGMATLFCWIGASLSSRYLWFPEEHIEKAKQELPASVI